MSITDRSAARTLERLRQEGDNGKQAPEGITSLVLQKLHTAEAFFQPRWGISERHVADLVQAVRSVGGALTPITVWWSGRHWYVLDGHHRAQAYRKFNAAQPARPITETPVEVFEGSVEEAHAKAVEANSKDHLRMELSDKANAAWRMVCLAGGGGNASNIGRSAGVTRQTVGKMQVNFSEMRERFAHIEPLEQSWRGVMDTLADRVPREWGDAEKEKQAQEWAVRLTRAGGDKFRKAPDIFARALEVYARDLIPRLVETDAFYDAVREYAMAARAAGEWEMDKEEVDTDRDSFE